MKIRYSVKNINCKSCANTIKNALEDDFGTIEIFLDKNPKELQINLKAEHEESFKTEMSDLGFPIIEEISRKL